MSVDLKAVALAWRFTQTVKQLPGFQGTGELRLAVGTMETGESQLAGTLETGESQIYGIIKTRLFPRYGKSQLAGTLETGELFYCLCEPSSQRYSL